MSLRRGVSTLAVALTVTVPLDAAVNRPVVLIAALPLPSATVHVTDWIAAVAGCTFADICSMPPLAVIAVAPPAPETVIEATGSLA